MKDAQAPRDGVPEDYPGRIVEFPPAVTHIAIAILGVQGGDAAAREAFIHSARRLAAEHDGPTHLERGHHTDPGATPTDILIAYWTDHDAATRWWQRAAVASWWAALDLNGACGYFRECARIPEARFNYAAGTEDRHGSAAVLPLAPSATFGYWGAYRDRLPASKTDDFKSPLAAVPRIATATTRGRRLRVALPDNLCYIREGQGWGNCAARERGIWETDMDPVIDQWVARLAADALATGCLTIRDCRESALTDGAPLERRTQIAFLLSLGHIEQAARTDPAHLAVHGAFVRMYTNPEFTPRMHVWVELAILKRDELDVEYVNCHNQTGFLPYFSAIDA